MDVECPNGTTVPMGTGCVCGRKHVGAAADDTVSREQFRLDLVDGLPDVVQLKVLGRNGKASPVITSEVARLACTTSACQLAMRCHDVLHIVAMVIERQVLTPSHLAAGVCLVSVICMSGRVAGYDGPTVYTPFALQVTAIGS